MNINILGSNCNYEHGTIQGNGWSTLISGLKSYGANLFFNDTSLLTYDLIICFDHYKWMEDIFNEISVPKNRRILIIQEPEVVLPRMYKPQTINLYGAVFAGSTDWAKRLGVKSFEYPVDISSSGYLGVSERNIETAMIQSNKFSCIKGEQYSLRRSVLELAEKNHYAIELYGEGWNRGYFNDLLKFSKYLKAIVREVEYDNFSTPFKCLGGVYPNYFGRIENKTNLLNNVKRNIVIENSSTYVSEKLFDSLRSGSVPFYVGPSLEKYGIPNFVAVLCKADPKNILEQLTTTTVEQLSEIQLAGNNFLESDECKKWSAQYQVNRFLQCMKVYT